MDNQLQKYIKDNYIPKKIIEEKIKQLENEVLINKKRGIKEDITRMQINILKDILEENMEEENYNHIPRID